MHVFSDDTLRAPLSYLQRQGSGPENTFANGMNDRWRILYHIMGLTKRASVIIIYAGVQHSTTIDKLLITSK
jgi:hypothetical protein